MDTPSSTNTIPVELESVSDVTEGIEGEIQHYYDATSDQHFKEREEVLQELLKRSVPHSISRCRLSVAWIFLALPLFWCFVISSSWGYHYGKTYIADHQPNFECTIISIEAHRYRRNTRYDIEIIGTHEDRVVSIFKNDVKNNYGQVNTTYPCKYIEKQNDLIKSSSVNTELKRVLIIGCTFMPFMLLLIACVSYLVFNELKDDYSTKQYFKLLNINRPGIIEIEEQKKLNNSTIQKIVYTLLSIHFAREINEINITTKKIIPKKILIIDYKCSKNQTCNIGLNDSSECCFMFCFSLPFTAAALGIPVLIFWILYSSVTGIWWIFLLLWPFWIVWSVGTIVLNSCWMEHCNVDWDSSIIHHIYTTEATITLTQQAWEEYTCHFNTYLGRVTRGQSNV